MKKLSKKLLIIKDMREFLKTIPLDTPYEEGNTERHVNGIEWINWFLDRYEKGEND